MKRRKEKFKEYIQFDTLDIETHEDDSFWFLGYTNEKLEYYSFMNVKDFLSYIYKLDKKLINIFGHYAGGFDFLIILRYMLDNLNVKYKDIYDSNGLLIFISFEFENGNTVNFRDSYALFRTSLNKVSAKLINKTKIEIDIKKRDSYSYNDMNDYCEQDNFILRESLEKYREIVKADFKISISSQSMENFKTYHLKHEWGNISKGIDAKLRLWYAGGRVEVYKKLASNGVWAYDVNNMYGYIMKKYGAPVGKPVTVKNLGTDCIGFYNILIERNYDIYNPFTWFRFNNKLMFVNSTQKVFKVTSHEIKLLKKYGIKYRIINGYEFDYDKDFFKSFLDFWGERLKQNFHWKIILKDYINSLYGKFGEKRIRKKVQIGKNDLQYYIDEYNLIGYNEVYQSADYSNVQIASWITSGGRYYLYKYLVKEKESLCYCDTDGFYLNKEIKDKSDLDQKQIGKLKCEGFYKKGIFLSPKMYCLTNFDNADKVCFKGFDTEKYNYENFEVALNKQASFVEFREKFKKFKTFFKDKDEILQLNLMMKKVNQFEIKRKFIDNYNTEAFTIHNNQLI